MLHIYHIIVINLAIIQAYDSWNQVLIRVAGYNTRHFIQRCRRRCLSIIITLFAIFPHLPDWSNTNTHTINITIRSNYCIVCSICNIIRFSRDGIGKRLLPSRSRSLSVLRSLLTVSLNNLDRQAIASQKCIFSRRRGAARCATL